MQAQTSPKQFICVADVLIAKGYSIGHTIGEGTYSKVRTVERIKDGEMCAVKIIFRSKLKKDYLKKFLPRELEIIIKLQHDNVICTYEVIHSKDYIFQIMRYAVNGDLLQLIHRNGFVCEDKSKTIFYDICHGLQYLHDMNIVHRDIKCENILLFQNNKAAISDFGFARSFDSGETNNICKTFCGSTAYASPEVLKGIPYDPKLNDVWGIGVVLFTMLCGTLPFDDYNIMKMVGKQMEKCIVFPSKFDKVLSQTCKSCVCVILEPDLNERKSITEILALDWVDKKTKADQME